MPLQATSGAASYDAFGGGVAAVPNYIEDVFSTWLYTGNGSTGQTINNGIDLSGKGGLVWFKNRFSTQGEYNVLSDTARGFTNYLSSNTTDAQAVRTGLATTSSGFSLSTGSGAWNWNGDTYASWTFREQPKFFDIVTYTGDGSSSGKVINHNLGSIPGAVIIKRTDSTSDWWAQVRRSDGQYAYGLRLNSTAAQQGLYTPTSGQLSSTQFSNFIADDPLATNTNGATYVAYLFAHDAGGFGLSGTDNVISCGSFTASSGAATVDLGYEPQWILFKRTNGAEGWNLVDNMRGWSYSATALLQANTSGAEDPNGLTANPTATGFQFGTGTLAASGTYIYIAIRRGPMKTPTTGTSVFAPVAYAGDNLDNRLVNTGVLTDMAMARARSRTSAGGFYTADRLRGDEFLRTAGSDAALTDSDTFMTPTIGVGNSFSAMNGFGVGNDATYRVNTESDQFTYALRRAPGFFDEVCYTGTGVARTVAHNLGVAPELMIVKSRSSGTLDWLVYSAPTGNANALLLNTTDASFGSSAWGSTTPTASVFSTGATSGTNNSGATFVAYLFASCPGVSKVGSYTGTGTTLQIDCGFTGGARFVLIKRTDSTGDWYVWDSARGIVAGNDPYLLLNSTAAEVTNTDYVDTYAAGFEISSTAPAAINANGGTFIFLAIA